jgi:two-component system, NtrC family, C4-dicarboxylate transport response regulator DctD
MDSPEAPIILVVDDDQYLLAAIGQTLQLNGYTVELFNNSPEALEQVTTKTYMAVIADIRMPFIDGMQLLSKINSIDGDLPVIMITGHGDITLAVQAIQAGAYDFLEKPVDEEVLLASLKRAVEKRQLITENRMLQENLARQSRQSYFRGMVGCHPLMHRLYEVIEIIARESDPVLLNGETGTGKELVAQAIHQIATPTGAFVGVNMAALPAEIIESELFGHEKGAFTGAVGNKIGKFEYAQKGTLFLDEICSLPLSLQAKLLRVLEERSFTRLGSNISRPLQARIISATNRDLAKEIEAGNFRQDLFYRLNALSIDIPPLRQRKEDIPLLVEFFRQEYCRERQQTIEPFSSHQLNKICAQDWPGNIRELRNYVRRLCVFGEKRGEDPGSEILLASPIEKHPRPALKTYMDQQEKEYIISILKECHGKVGLAYQILGLSRKGLYDKVNKYGIHLDMIKNA